MNQVWDKQTGESSEAHSAFLVYRDLSAGDRSLLKVAQELSKSLALLKRWSAQWQWVGRAGAWDAYLQVEADKVHLAEVKTFREKAISTAVYVHNKVWERLQQEDFWATLQPKQVLEFLEYAMELEAFGRGVDMDAKVQGNNASGLPKVPPQLCKLYVGIPLEDM